MSKEKPILFSTTMVKAILDGTKTMTRRVNKDLTQYDKVFGYDLDRRSYAVARYYPDGTEICQVELPLKYCSGDILWVRETWLKISSEYIYYVDKNKAVQNCLKWKPSIFMPKEAARIFLEVKSVRVERLQTCSVYNNNREVPDIIAEGIEIPETCERDCPTPKPDCYVCLFKELWDSLNAKRGYSLESNPWVWVYEFERINKESI